ncbi:phosphopantetheine-binding protein [Streptococcus suis]|uniref:phosphopantetheine-binding protein n=1 Tax=Streptococcus suis TaxID=1307 RepID=UPI002ACB5751|nr:hypothetical protein [Streptococcus suis]HEN7857950.1 hypothetical protein [Streptococcus agalactiae]HEO5423738.1 hypothetical protein [Streptococcus agalactiae]
MSRKQYGIEYMGRIYRGEYQMITSQDGAKAFVIEPELEEPDSTFKANYIDNVSEDYGVEKRAYYVKKFLSNLLCEINMQKIKIGDKNEKIIKYWSKYVEDFQIDEIYEREIIEDSIYRKLQCKQNLFIEIIKDNYKKKLLLMDKEISPEILGLKSKFTRILLEKVVENINNVTKDREGLRIAIINDVQNYIKDNLVSKISGIYEIILLDDDYDKKFLNEEFLGKFDHIISVNFLHRINDIETFLKFSKLMLKDNGKLHIIDFCKMDPVSILTAAFFQEEYIDVETKKRTQFFYRADYIKKLVKKYYIKNTLFSMGDDSVFYFESESHTDYFELIKKIENNIGSDCDEKIVLVSPEHLDSSNNTDGIIETNINSYDESIEDILKTIWIKNLGIDNIDRNSNYFRLGGNSLSATKLLVEVERKLKCRLTLNEVFSNSEFESLLSLIESKQINAEIIEGEI